MNSKSLTLRIFVGVLLIAVLVSCSSPTPTPTLAPTVDIQPTLDSVRTQAALTVIADLTRNAPTVTSTKANTATSAPSQTPLATAKATGTLLPWWTTTPTQPAGGCSITSTSPKQNTSFAPNADFDATWEIKNTGDVTWQQEGTDIGYSSGTKFHQSAEIFDLENDVSDGESYTFTVDMRAPGDKGTYTTTWAVKNGGQIICSMSLTIVVK